MIKNAIRVRYNALKDGIKKYVPPIDLSGIGEVILEDIEFENNQGVLTTIVETSGTVKGRIKLVGELVLSNAKDTILFDVHDIEFIKLPLALKLTAGLLKQKIISVIEGKARITDKQLLAMLSNGAQGMLGNLAASNGVEANINLSDLKFVYVLTDNQGIEICTEVNAEPNIDIKTLP